jgi:hypothetical protein
LTPRTLAIADQVRAAERDSLHGFHVTADLLAFEESYRTPDQLPLFDHGGTRHD